MVLLLFAFVVLCGTAEGVLNPGVSFFFGGARYSAIDKLNGNAEGTIYSAPNLGTTVRLGLPPLSTSARPVLSMEVHRYSFASSVDGKTLSNTEAVDLRFSGGVRWQAFASLPLWIHPQLAVRQERAMTSTSRSLLEFQRATLFELSLMGTYEFFRRAPTSWMGIVQISTPFSTNTAAQSIRNGFGIYLGVEAGLDNSAGQRLFGAQYYFARISVDSRFRNTNLTDNTVQHYLFELGMEWGRSPRVEQSSSVSNTQSCGAALRFLCPGRRKLGKSEP